MTQHRPRSLPGRARVLSALLPPGAAVWAVTDFGHFGGARTTGPLAVLALWSAAGLGLVLLRQARSRPASRSQHLAPGVDRVT